MQRALRLPPSATDTASDEAPVIDVPAGLDRTEALHQALRQTYRIEEDDRALREGLLVPPEQHAAVFDRLRRDYPRRRELAGSRLSGDSRDASTRWLAGVFACAVEDSHDR